MQFKVGDKVKFTETHCRQGFQGTVIRRCGAYDDCRVVNLGNGVAIHVLTQYLILEPAKNEQLLFSFMD